MDNIYTVQFPDRTDYFRTGIDYFHSQNMYADINIKHETTAKWTSEARLNENTFSNSFP